MGDANYSPGGVKARQGGTAYGTQVDERGNTLVGSSIRYAAAAVVHATNPVHTTDSPCDALFCGVDTTVTCLPAENADNDTPIAFALKGGMWHPMAVKRVTANTAGTLIAGWLRKQVQ